MQVLDLYCRSYGDQRNSFHLGAIQVAQKTTLNISLLKKREMCHIREIHTYNGSFGLFHSD
jgi:hypothetical protein